MTKVKICGITNLEDALLSVKFGADALGFNFYAKSPRYILPENAREIIEQLPAEVLKVGVFVNETLDKIAEIAKTAKLNALQLHGEETPEFAAELKLKTGLEIIKAFRVSPDFTPEDVLKYEVDAILLDAYNPQEYGGTGETFDWKIARKVQEIFPKMYLAGGLSADNTATAIRMVKPFALDSCSCLESEKGKKDKVKVINFIKFAKLGNKISNSISNSEKIEDIYALLDVIQIRPGMYLGYRSITNLRMFLYGIEFSLNTLVEVPSKFNWRQFKPNLHPQYAFGFHNWIIRKLLKSKESPYGWDYIILQKTDNDEEKALEYFFALLEEFKLEKEDLNS